MSSLHGVQSEVLRQGGFDMDALHDVEDGEEGNTYSFVHASTIHEWGLWKRLLEILAQPVIAVDTISTAKVGTIMM